MVDRSRNEDAAVVRNIDILEIVADFLGVQPYALEAALTRRSYARCFLTQIVRPTTEMTSPKRFTRRSSLG
jgi:hypothetical protein